MALVGILIVLPLLVALLVVTRRNPEQRAWLVRWASYALVGLTVLLSLVWFRAPPDYFTLPPGWTPSLDHLFTGGGILLSLVLLYMCRRIRLREAYIPVLILVQTGLVLYAELSPGAPHVEQPFYVDSFSILMALIVGIVGGLICIHAIRYMADYHAHADEAHPAVPDRQSLFFFVVFLFLGAMFGISFSNHLGWLFFFWEVTTFSSFWLIGYSQTEEATRNAYLALGLNMIGGVFFAGALVWLSHGPGIHTWALDELVASGSAVALFPAVLIAVAGLTKSAQMPFSSWLLGAMVAPTPVSALLHSSTMVKAGVFILVKLAPVFHGTVAGFLLALIGGISFLITSLAAVSQSNAKLVLAYSTIANLGLVVMCAGLGTVATLWAAILLIVFHAVAKGLLFLGVGTTEHMIGSRDIEDMEGLLYRRPLIAGILAVGVLGMFLAPFGMLLSKYTLFKALLEAHAVPGAGAVLTGILAFGSAPTLFFWTKWLGKLVAMPRRTEPMSLPIPRDEGIALVSLAVITYVACALFPLADWIFVQPHVAALIGAGLIPAGDVQIPWETVGMMTLMLGGLFLLPLLFWLWPPQYKEVSAYLSGANVNGSASFRGAAGAERQVTTRSYYLAGFLNEQRLTFGAVLATSVVAVVMLASVTL
jgi:ech hydrogenase subunit A